MQMVFTYHFIYVMKSYRFVAYRIVLSITSIGPTEIAFSCLLEQSTRRIAEQLIIYLPESCLVGNYILHCITPKRMHRRRKKTPGGGTTT